MRPIEETNIVNVYYVDGSQFNDLIVRHVPCDVGDMWYFERDDGSMIAQNPMSANLDTIIKPKKEQAGSLDKDK